MNPVLVKPEADNRSQVIVLGEPDLELSGRPGGASRAALAGDRSSLRSLGSTSTSWC